MKLLYLINIIFSMCYLSELDKKKIEKKIVYLLFALPIMIFWVIILGGQYYVGSDYPTYLSYFKGDFNPVYFYNKGEYIFYFFIKFSNKLKIEGQGLFFLISFIEVVLFFVILNELKIRKKVQYIFLYFTVITLFHFQMNGVRQALSIYIIMLALIFFQKKEYFKFIFSILIGALVHRGSLLILPFILLSRVITSFKYKTIVNISLVLLIVSFFNIDKIILSILSEIPRYSHYQNSGYLMTHIDIFGKLTKYIYLPLYVVMFRFFKKRKKTGKESDFYIKIGIVSIGLRMLLLVSPLTNRLGISYQLFMLYPIYKYMEMTKNKKIVYIINIVLFIIYFFKIIVFPRGAFLYKFFLFY